jgi:hypothetical protein
MEAPDAWPPAQHPSPAVAGAAQGPNPPGSPHAVPWAGLGLGMVDIFGTT